MTQEALFARERTGRAERFRPLTRARSGWGEQIRGMAVTGLLARDAEALAAEEGLGVGFRPVRFTVDLFRPAGIVESEVRSVIVRRGRRLCVIDSVFAQQGRDISSSRTLFAAEKEDPGGRVWSAGAEIPPIPTIWPTSEDGRLFHSAQSGWTQVGEAPEAVVRRASWTLPTSLVEGEPLSGFIFAASIADVGNIMSNWGDRGLRFINADVTLALTRMPRTDGLGLVADDRQEGGGVSLGTTTMFDVDGPCGLVLTAALANGAHAVDPRTKGRRVDD